MSATHPISDGESAEFPRFRLAAPTIGSGKTSGVKYARPPKSHNAPCRSRKFPTLWTRNRRAGNFQEPWAGSAFDGSKLPRMRLLARVDQLS